MSNLTEKENDDLMTRMLSVSIERFWQNDLKEALLKGLTGDDYIEQEKWLSRLYNDNFNKHK